METNTGPKSYFQFAPDWQTPLFFDVETEIARLLEGPQWESIGLTRLENAESIKRKRQFPAHRCIKVHQAGPKVQKQLGETTLEDKFGRESMMGRTGFQIYRMAGACMMIFSPTAREWELALHPHHLSLLEDDKGASQQAERLYWQISLRTAIARILGWSLTSYHVSGFWGHVYDDGVVVCQQNRSAAEFFLVHPRKRMLATFDGVTKISDKANLYKYEPSLDNSTRNLGREEVLGALKNNDIYFSYLGINPTRSQTLFEVARLFRGRTLPTKNTLAQPEISHGLPKAS